MILYLWTISQQAVPGGGIHPEIRENSAWMREVGKASDNMMNFGVSAADAVVIAAMVPVIMMVLRMFGEFTSVWAEDLRENNKIKREEKRLDLYKHKGKPPDPAGPGEPSEGANGRPL